MLIIDSHVHLYPPGANGDPVAWAAAKGEQHWATLCTRRRRDGRWVQGFSTVAELLREMDMAGVAQAVLLGWYWETPETCVEQNRFYVECVRAFPDRLRAFATVHPAAGREAVLAEIRWAHSEGMVGIGELSPHSQGCAIDDPRWTSVFELAGELHLPVNLHVTDPESRDYPGKVATPLEDFVRIAQVHPRTTFILAHWGGLLPLRDAAAKALANVYYDTAASPLLYDASVWMRFVGAVGAERVVFGSDYPLNLYPKLDAEPNLKRFVGETKGTGLGVDELAMVLGGNARRLGLGQ